MSIAFPKPYDSARDNTLAFVRFLMLLVVLMGVGMFYMMHIVDQAQQEIQVSIPPDLTHGVTMRAGDKDDTELYAFALTQLQSLHHWIEDGSVEYQQRIKEHEDLITPSYRAFLQRDHERRKKQGELHMRSRVLMPLPGSFFSPDKVKRLGSDDWEVELELQLIETYLGGTIKKIKFSYPVHIVRYDVGKRNPWKLALDGYTREPEKIMEKGDESK
jgi:integrating conjugative element protein (TIGR03746 family)